ncbi:hypothetical protein GCM10027432_17260 [Lysobacter fragariae]
MRPANGKAGTKRKPADIAPGTAALAEGKKHECADKQRKPRNIPGAYSDPHVTANA